MSLSETQMVLRRGCQLICLALEERNHRDQSFVFKSLEAQQLPRILTLGIAHDSLAQSLHSTSVFELGVGPTKIEVGSSIWLQSNRFLEGCCCFGRALQLQVGT